MELYTHPQMIIKGGLQFKFFTSIQMYKFISGNFSKQEFFFQFSKSIDLPSLGSITLPLFNKEDYANLAFGFYLQNIVLKCLKVNNTNCIFPVTKKEEVSSSWTTLNANVLYTYILTCIRYGLTHIQLKKETI